MKREVPSFQGKTGTIVTDSLGKLIVFPVMALFSTPYPKIWYFHPQKNFIFIRSNNKVTCYVLRFHNVSFKIVDLVATL